MQSVVYIKYKNDELTIYVVEEDDDFDYYGLLDEFILENILFYDIEIIS